MSGLLRITSNAEIDAQERAEQERRSGLAARDRFESALAGQIRKQWEINKQAKRDVEERLLTCLRQRNGEYDPDVLAEIRAQGGSELYMQLTAVKCRAAASWIRDIMVPVGDRPWALEPTPIPEVPPQIMAMIQQQVIGKLQAEAQESGQQITEEVLQAALEQARTAALEHAADFARKAADKMEEKVADQLAEGRWEEALSEFIEDFVTFPASILKGPVLRQRRTFKWSDDFLPIQETELRHEFGRVSPFDIYPSPGAVHVNDGNLIEHLRFSRGDLYAMIGTPGYSDEAIREALTEYGRGGLRMWIWNESERARLEGRTHDHLANHEGLIDALHYWGSAQGLLLLEWGIPPELVNDPLAEYEIEAILVGRHVIRCQINDDPMARRPYHKASYQIVPGAWWGTCPPELMADIQRVCNATARSLVNNLAISSGPQIELYADRLADGEQITQMHPWKIWQMKSDPMGGSNNRALNFFQPASNAGELLAVFEAFERRADDATNIPRYAYGNERVGGAGGTASGLAMLMDSASKGIKAAISHVDSGVVRPSIEMLWYDNMLFDEDESIKGDCKVVARGASVLIARDQANARRAEILGMTNNPTDMQILGIAGRAKLLRETLNALDMQGIIPEQEELEAQLAAQQENQPPDPKMLEQERKAKELEFKAQDAEAERQHERELKQMDLMARMEELLLKIEGQVSAASQRAAGNDRFPR